MKIDFSQKLLTVTGQPLKWGNPNGTEEATLRHVSLEALLNPTSIDRLEERDTKVRRWRMAQQIHAAKGPIDVPVEDVALLKELIGVVYATAVVGPAFDILDG